jgi:tRNA threonylcarbamoyladenosine biosynthesis protein TsaB
MLVLGIDTSTLTASVALARDGVVVAANDVETRAHGDVLLTAIDALVRAAGLAPADLGAVAVGAGPGSFTGLRIGMATAKGIAFAAGVPLYVVSSLAALAQDAGASAEGDPLLVPVLDARRGEVYAGFYRRDGAAVREIAREQVLAPGALAAAIEAAAGSAAAAAIVVGDATRMPALAGAFALPPSVHVRPDLRATPSGTAVALLASTGEHRDALTDGAPQYIRPAEAEVKYPDGVPGALRRR